MSELRVFLLGGVRVVLGRTPSEVGLARSGETLLAYLMLARNRRHSRDTLCSMFWPDLPHERARGALSTTLWRLRRVLESSAPRGTYLCSSPTGEVGFNSTADYWLDVEVLESHVGVALRGRGRGRDLEDDAARRLEAVLRLYTGDLLEGLYDDWVVLERQRIRLLFIDGLGQLLDYHDGRGALDQAMVCGQRILQLEPLSEEIHRRMMELYAASGRRPLAVRQYETCCKVLARELGISPMEETVAVYRRLVHGNGSTRPAGRSAGDASGERTELDSIRERLESARASVESAMEALDRVEAKRAGSGEEPAAPRGTVESARTQS
jgi:DNA-binding SARP family transcriptional activator